MEELRNKALKALKLEGYLVDGLAFDVYEEELEDIEFDEYNDSIIDLQIMAQLGI